MWKTTLTKTEQNDMFWHVFGRAAALRDRGLYAEATEEALQALSLAGSDHVNRGVAQRELGLVAELQGQLATAVSYYEAAIASLPKSELASLALFHAYLQWGKNEQAIDEADRFTRVRFSQDYYEIVSAGFGADVSEQYAKKVMGILARLQSSVSGAPEPREADSSAGSNQEPGERSR